MTPGRYDVVIVGAGAAGCTCALSLFDGMDALLIDRHNPEEGRCCGGLVAPDAQAAISRLGLELPETVRVSPEPKRVHVLDLESGREQSYARDYWNVDRARFDSWFLKLACRKAEFRPQTRFVVAEREPAGFRITVSHAGTNDTIRCRYLVGAGGAGSAVRKRFFSHSPAPARSTALQVELPAGRELDTHEVLFSSELTDFYAWAIPKNGHILVGSAFSDISTAGPGFRRIIELMCERHGLRNEVLSRHARSLTRPAHHRELLSGGDCVLLCGEEAGLVSPSSGEGLSYAIESGWAAARSLAAPVPDAAYRLAFREPARKVVRKLAKSRVIFTPWTRRLAMRIPWCP